MLENLYRSSLSGLKLRERRFAAGTKVERSEAGTWQFSLALDCLYELDIPNPTLQQLLNPWIYAESMRFGFLSAGPLKCVYVDRLVMLTNFLGHNNVLDLEQEVNLPFFEDDRTAELTWLPHRPVSGVVHLGSQASGHFVTSALTAGTRWMMKRPLRYILSCLNGQRKGWCSSGCVQPTAPWTKPFLA